MIEKFVKTSTLHCINLLKPSLELLNKIRHLTSTHIFFLTNTYTLLEKLWYGLAKRLREWHYKVAISINVDILRNSCKQGFCSSRFFVGFVLFWSFIGKMSCQKLFSLPINSRRLFFHSQVIFSSIVIYSYYVIGWPLFLKIELETL